MGWWWTCARSLKCAVLTSPLPLHASPRSHPAPVFERRAGPSFGFLSRLTGEGAAAQEAVKLAALHQKQVELATQLQATHRDNTGRQEAASEAELQRWQAEGVAKLQAFDWGWGIAPKPAGV